MEEFVLTIFVGVFDPFGDAAQVEGLETLATIPDLRFVLDFKEANRAGDSSLFEKFGKQISQFFLLNFSEIKLFFCFLFEKIFKMDIIPSN